MRKKYRFRFRSEGFERAARKGTTTRKIVYKSNLANRYANASGKVQKFGILFVTGKCVQSITALARPVNEIVHACAEFV